MPSHLFQHRLPRLIHRATGATRGLALTRDVPYAARPGCTLDVLRPRGAPGTLPTVLHIHGGAFRVLSKDTHTHMAARYARLGAVVFNVDYRLAPEHPFPAAVEDVHDALLWVLDHAAHHGADPGRLLLTGESAGGNLVLGLLVSMTLPRSEPWAGPVFERALRPRAAHVVYGLLQASGLDRFDAAAPVRGRLRRIETDYLQGRTEVPYADPLVVLEQTRELARPLPPLLVPCGTADLIAEDSRRLTVTARRLGAPVTPVWALGARHAYHGLPGRRSTETWEAIRQHARAHLVGARQPDASGAPLPQPS